MQRSVAIIMKHLNRLTIVRTCVAVTNLSLLALTSGCAASAPTPVDSGSIQTSETIGASAAGHQAPTPIAFGPAALDHPPAQTLDLTRWMLSLPVGEAFQPTEVVQPALASFVQEGLFYASAKGVVFRAHAGGVTVPSSSYPSAELSEMVPGGARRAEWSTTEGRHSMTLTTAITHTPISQPHVVTGQLHGAKGEVVAIRLEREHLFVAAGGNNLGTLETQYTLGTVFNVVIDASEGRVRVYYNGEQTPRVDVERKVDGCYFKAGAYTLSNPTKGDQHDAYSEVIISQLSVSHVN